MTLDMSVLSWWLFLCSVDSPLEGLLDLPRDQRPDTEQGKAESLSEMQRVDKRRTGGGVGEDREQGFGGL